MIHASTWPCLLATHAAMSSQMPFMHAHMIWEDAQRLRQQLLQTLDLCQVKTLFRIWWKTKTSISESNLIWSTIHFITMDLRVRLHMPRPLLRALFIKLDFLNNWVASSVTAPPSDDADVNTSPDFQEDFNFLYSLASWPSTNYQLLSEYANTLSLSEPATLQLLVMVSARPVLIA